MYGLIIFYYADIITRTNWKYKLKSAYDVYKCWKIKMAERGGSYDRQIRDI